MFQYVKRISYNPAVVHGFYSVTGRLWYMMNCLASHFQFGCICAVSRDAVS